MSAAPHRSSSPAQARREDRELLRRYHDEGDTSAREELIERHLPLVRSLARRYSGRGESLEDIEQVGRHRADQGDRPLRALARRVARHLRHAERGGRDQAPLPRQGLGHPRAARAPGAERLDVRRDRAADRQARALAEHRRDRRGAEDHAGGGARGDGGGLGLLDRLALHRPQRRGGARPARDDRRGGRGLRALARTASRSSRRSTACPTASARSCGCASRRGCRRPRSPRRVGLSQMHVSRLIRKSLAEMREELA